MQLMGGKKRGTRGLLSNEVFEARYRFIWEYHKQYNMVPSFVEMSEAWGVTVSVVLAAVMTLYSR